MACKIWMPARLMKHSTLSPPLQLLHGLPSASEQGRSENWAATATVSNNVKTRLRTTQAKMWGGLDFLNCKEERHQSVKTSGSDEEKEG
jgi:hypothetical protein